MFGAVNTRLIHRGDVNMGKARLQDKVAIITGAGQGIGEGIASVFADEGAKVVVATRTEKNGSETVDKIRAAGGEAILITCDIGAADSAPHW